MTTLFQADQQPSSSNTLAQTSSTSAIVQPKVTSLHQSMGAIVFGAAILFAVGFMPVEAAHNAAHDSRHTLSFPCH